MSWSYFFVAVVCGSVIYFRVFLRALYNRVIAQEKALAALASIRVKLIQLENRLASLERTTRIDPQTGVGSALWFEAERWFAALRSKLPLCVAWFDLDGLKARNDTEGHAAGDAIIQSMAEALRTATRRGYDEVFRLHTKGDEFIILLHGPLSPVRVASEIRKSLRAHGVKAFGGMAYSTDEDHTKRAELRRLAEQGCRRAKERRGDCPITVWSEGQYVDAERFE